MVEKVGIVDVPIGERVDKNIKIEDMLGIGNYVESLTKFIKNCYTPMSLAIQGDWGSGKTSIMNLIKNELGDKYIKVDFNTWQYSQFDGEKDLVYTFMNNLIYKLSETTNDKEKVRELTKTLLKLSKNYIESKINIDVDEILSEENSFLKMEKLKENFSDLIQSVLKKNNSDRVVFFIDDLDRLNPGKAIELLEVIKLFLDVEGCIFVLAIDYEIVSKGVAIKYGEDIGESKSKDYFDKIIQVPFKMPIELYKITEFIKSENLFNIKDEKIVKIVEKIFVTSIGNNPRTIKRMGNSFQLLKYISNIDNSTEKEYERALLMAVLCLQNEYPDLYTYMLNEDNIYYYIETDEEENESTDNEFAFWKIDEDYTSKLAEKMEIDIKGNENKTNRYKSYVQMLLNLLSVNGEDKIKSNLEKLNEILSYSSIVGVNMEKQKFEGYISLYAKEKIKGYKVLGIEYKNENSIDKEDKNNFTSGVIWFLKEIGKIEEIKKAILKYFSQDALRKEAEKNKDFINKDKIYNNIPARYFVENFDLEKYSEEEKLRRKAWKQYSKFEVKFNENEKIMLSKNLNSNSMKDMVIRILDKISEDTNIEEKIDKNDIKLIVE
ncbi:KAP family P-loop NTPase fold protein [Miniphocaeibacter massiliensis]|uniref:KAP family P-loop NTPase fold protein n=1 Tax=Miniphocaeibacter massiliensis TaxID=2041841 RepID=UPI0013EC70F4|nr:P-loop NTPase fold protein [Miniphocaeibacter massiliensis]